MEFAGSFSEQPLCDEANAYVDVSVIIPSRAESSRAGLIDRAIESVLAQDGVRAKPIVVFNGHHYDSNVLNRLTQRAGIRCLFVDGGLEEARVAGRDAVDAPFFAFLDDDDEFLPGSLEVRLKPLLHDLSIDVVVSNGFRETATGTIVTNPGIERYQHDPLRSLLNGCWLNANGGLFRSASIPRDFFAGLPPTLEWSYLAFHLAQTRKIHFIDVQTFICRDTPNSLSKSKMFLLNHPSVWLRLLNTPLPDDVRVSLKRKYYSILHNLSVDFLERGELRSAWRFHLESLAYLGGWKYLPYTRHIVWQQFAKRLPPKCGG